MTINMADAAASKTTTRDCADEEVEHYSLINVPTPVLSVPANRAADFFPQILACLIVTILNIHAGINMAFSAILLPQLMTPVSTVLINEDQASWIASIVTISTPIGSLLSGPLMDKFGRKAICKLTCIPLLASWIIIAFVKSIHGLYWGRLLAGFGAGLSTASLVYISEISHPTWRPMLLCLISVAVSLGILLTCVLCLWLHYDQMALCFAVISLASYVATCPLPESPHWLLRNRAGKVAQDSLRWLYRRDVCFQYQLTCLMDNNKQPLASTSKQKSFAEYFSAYKKRSNIKPIVILIFIFVFQQISGAYVIIFYAVNILQIAGGKLGTGVSEYGALVTLGLIRFTMSIFTAFVSRIWGRRPVSIISGMGMAISMLVAAICINKSEDAGNLFRLATLPQADNVILTTQSYQSSSLVWSSHNASWPAQNVSKTIITSTLIPQGDFRAISELNMTYSSSTHESTTYNKLLNTSTTTSSPAIQSDGQVWSLVCILLYVFFSSFGVLVIPWTLVGELLPMSVRGSCGGLVVALTYVVMFAVVKVFPYFLKVFKAHGTFYIFSVTSFLGSVFVYMFLPETRGKSFQEIEKYFE